jgi:hypothetical protein
LSTIDRPPSGDKVLLKNKITMKGNFVLNSLRRKIPTNETMYDCADCLKEGIEHKIIIKSGPPACGNEVSMKGDATTIRVCTGCGREDGPWVPAPW